MNRKQKVAELNQKYNISVTGRHVQVTPAMKAYATDKISKLERIAPRIIDVMVIMDIQKLNHTVEIIMKYGPTLLKSQAATTDMYISIDQAVDKLEAQLKRYLRKVHEHHGKSHEELQEEEVSIPERVYERMLEEVDEVELNEAIEKEGKKRDETFRPHKIMKTESQPLKILTNEEAIRKMDLNSTPVMVFLSEQDRKIKVIYRRNDGNYGIIEPEARVS